MKIHEKKKYILTIVITLAALVFMVGYNFISFYSNAKENMLAVGKNSLAQETEELTSYLTKGMDVLQVTAITIEYMMQKGASPEELETFLVEESNRYKTDIDVNFTGIYGVFHNNYLDGIGWEPEPGYVPQEREWYITAKEAQGKPVVVSPYLDAQTNTIMISVSQLLYDNESVISLDIALDAVQQMAENIQLNNMGYGFIVDRNGLVIAHTNSNEKGKNYQTDAEMMPVLEKMYVGSDNTFPIKIAGESCTIFTNTIMDDWYVSLVVSDTKLFHDIRMLLVRNILISFVVFILVFSFCTSAFRKMQWHMQKAEKSRQNVESLNATLMHTLARTIDAKDRYTNGHSHRVAKYTLELAKRLGKSEEEQKYIYYAALLHDVGKIRVPDNIINKPSRLTDEEFDCIKLHPVSGYYILKDIEESEFMIQGAKWHHERYDGKGYPNGLAGENIPEVARIIGVADAYDAMTSNRSYRKTLPQAVARREIENGIGTQFDPKVATVMLEMIDDDKDFEMHETEDDIKRILVVDKDLDHVHRIETYLEDESHYVIHNETTIAAALQCLNEYKVDLILLDTQVTDMNGSETYFQVHHLSNAPIVFMTTDKSLKSIEAANKLGVIDYLIKPFTPQTLKEILHSILQESVDM